MRRGWEKIKDGTEWETGNAGLVAYLKCRGYQPKEHVEGTYVTFRFTVGAMRQGPDGEPWKDPDGKTRTIEQDRAYWQMNDKDAREMRAFSDTFRDVMGRIHELKPRPRLGG